MVVRTKINFKRPIFTILLLIFIAFAVFLAKIALPTSELLSLFLSKYTGSPALSLPLPSVLFDALNQTPMPTPLPPVSSVPIKPSSSDTASSDPPSRLYFKSKTANLFPTDTKGLSCYGRVFVKGKDTNVKSLLSSEADFSKRKIVIITTHFTEGYSEDTEKYYNDAQNTEDITKNVFSAAVTLAAELDALGLEVEIKDNAFDLPLQNGSFERSGEFIKQYIANDPDVALILDIHRDSLKEENLTGIRTCASYGGAAAAQIFASVPENTEKESFEASLLFAAKLHNMLESECPTITRPVEILSGNYGFDGKAMRILLNIGTQSNTADEAKLSASITAKAIYAVMMQGR